jgi:hypothetical protein
MYVLGGSRTSSGKRAGPPSTRGRGPGWVSSAAGVLLISHRFSTVRSADRIYVLSEGRLVKSGTHAELLARGGTYAELFTLQASPYQQ